MRRDVPILARVLEYFPELDELDELERGDGGCLLFYFPLVRIWWGGRCRVKTSAKPITDFGYQLIGVSAICGQQRTENIWALDKSSNPWFIKRRYEL